MTTKSTKSKNGQKQPTDFRTAPSSPKSAYVPVDAYEYMAGPIERIEHDLSVEHVTPEEFRSAQQFVRACEKTGAWRLKQGELTDDAGFYVAELARELAQSIARLIEEGDLMLARRLPPIVEILQRAVNAYGSKITGRVEKRLSIGEILKKRKARALLQMVSALHPDWETLLHIPNRREIESLSEEKLRELLLSKERWFHERDGTVEWRGHRLAEVIENIIAIREAENENINLFVEHLWRGWFWGGPKRTFTKCDWHGKENLPERDDVRVWMKIIMPFLRRETDGDAMKLAVFANLLASRRYVYAGGEVTGGRLAGDSTTYIWNQVENRIRKAWRTMATRSSKRNFAKSA